jgi:hypothetical protein
MSTQTYATPSYSNIDDNKPKSVAPHFDLSSLLNLQKNYAMNLDGINVSGAEGEDSAITKLNKKLGVLNDDINGSKIKADATLLKQDAVNDILNTENERLLAKKRNIDVAAQGQQRMINLNNNYQKRYAVYSKIFMVIVGFIAVILLLNFLSTYFTIIPRSIYILLYIVIVTGSLIYIIMLYSTLVSRNPMNYDEDMLPQPTNVGDKVLGATPTNDSGVSADYTNAFGPYYNCLGQQCCAPGLVWSYQQGCSLPGPAQAPAST